jgi:hypothetical protein
MDPRTQFAQIPLNLVCITPDSGQPSPTTPSDVDAGTRRSRQREGLILLITTTHRHQPDLLATQLDLELITRAEVQQRGIGLAHQQVAVALNRGDVAEHPVTGPDSHSSRASRCPYPGLLMAPTATPSTPTHVRTRSTTDHDK